MNVRRDTSHRSTKRPPDISLNPKTSSRLNNNILITSGLINLIHPTSTLTSNQRANDLNTHQKTLRDHLPLTHNPQIMSIFTRVNDQLYTLLSKRGKPSTGVLAAIIIAFATAFLLLGLFVRFLVLRWGSKSRSR